jgi:hypothetical protein
MWRNGRALFIGTSDMKAALWFEIQTGASHCPRAENPRECFVAFRPVCRQSTLMGILGMVLELWKVPAVLRWWRIVRGSHLMRIGDNVSTPNRLTHFLSVSGLKRDWMDWYTNISMRLRFWVLTAVTVNNIIIWDTKPCSLVEVFRSFWRAHCLHLQGLRAGNASKHQCRFLLMSYLQISALLLLLLLLLLL